MNANLLIKTNGRESLAEFVAMLTEAVGWVGWEERQSCSYPDDHYYRTNAPGLEITVALADDAEFCNYEFWICLEPDPWRGGEKSRLDGVGDCVARKIAQRGYEVIRPYAIERIGGGGMVYRLDPTSDGKSGESVFTNEI